MSDYDAATKLMMNSALGAPSATDELGQFLSGQAAYVALEQAVHELGQLAGKDNDVMLKAGDITVGEIVYIEPYTLLFRGVNDQGQHAFALCYFSQITVRFTFIPKGNAKREPIGFRVDRPSR